MNKNELIEYLDHFRGDLYKKTELGLIKINADLEKKLSLINDRISALEKLGGAKMFPRKICGMCSGTGKLFYGTMCEPPIGNCYICEAKGWV